MVTMVNSDALKPYQRTRVHISLIWTNFNYYVSFVIFKTFQLWGILLSVFFQKNYNFHI